MKLEMRKCNREKILEKAIESSSETSQNPAEPGKCRYATTRIYVSQNLRSRPVQNPKDSDLFLKKKIMILFFKYVIQCVKDI